MVSRRRGAGRKEEYHPHPPPLQVRTVLLKILLPHDMLLWTNEVLNSHKLHPFQCTFFLDGISFKLLGICGEYHI
jgi:hypothetical protein